MGCSEQSVGFVVLLALAFFVGAANPAGTQAAVRDGD